MEESPSLEESFLVRGVTNSRYALKGETMKEDLAQKLAVELYQLKTDSPTHLAGFIRAILTSINAKLVEDWQDMDRTYTPTEQQLDMRIDGSTMRG